MTFIDLTYPKTIIESLMTDTCKITRRVNGTRDATLNTTTGRLTDAAPITVYEGPCKFKPQFVPQPSSEGGREVVVMRYDFGIPLPTDPANEPLEGDHVEITSAMRDPHAAGKELRIEGGIEYKTFALQRRFVCELRAPVGDRP